MPTVNDMKKSSLDPDLKTKAQEMLFECLKDELKDLYEYNRSSGNIYLAWFTLHWTINLGVLAACLSSYERVQPVFKEITLTFVFLNLLSVAACIAVLKFIHALERRVSEILSYMNSAIAAQNTQSKALTIQLQSAYPYVLSVRIQWLTQMTIWILVLLWLLVFFRIGI